MYSTIEAKLSLRRQLNFDDYMEGRRNGKRYYTDYRPKAVKSNMEIGAPNVCEDNHSRKFIAMEIP